jgi:hypothetical protein
MDSDNDVWSQSDTATSQLVEAFRAHYRRHEQHVHASIGPEFGDAVVLERAGDELDDYLRRFNQVSTACSDLAKSC